MIELSTPQETLSPAEGEKSGSQINILHDSCLNDKSHATNIFNMTKILIGSRCNSNVSNLAKLRTCVQSKYFNTEETALETFFEHGL